MIGKTTSIITLQFTSIGASTTDPQVAAEVAKRFAEVLKNYTNVDDVTVLSAKVFVHDDDGE